MNEFSIIIIRFFMRKILETMKLLKKFRKNLGVHFPAQQAQAIYDLCQDHATLDQMPVNQFVDLLVT